MSQTAPNITEIRLEPIGHVQSPLKTPSLRGGKGGIKRDKSAGEHPRHENNVESSLVLDPKYAELLCGLDGFSHALVIYWPHLLPAEARGATKVHPAGLEDFEKVGIFATCSPARPNPLLTTVVRVLGVEGNVLKVFGLEAVDGSPVLDIKPYNPHYLLRPKATVSDWMEKIDAMFPSEATDD